MYYINGASAISHQPTFQNKGYSNTMQPLPEEHDIIAPIYKDYIQPNMLRRMSKILRMSIAGSMDCLAQSGIEEADAIIVGTGLGCLHDTEKFLDTFLTVDGLLPPTSFIQSTHNTMAGQISLQMKNHNYNMTHTQNNVSFELALGDTLLRLNEKDSNVLVGAADEQISILSNLAQELELNHLLGKLTSGAAFFIVSNQPTDKSLAKIIATKTLHSKNIDLNQEIKDFIAEENPDLILTNTKLPEGYSEFDSLNYNELFGYNFTNSALALHFATDRLSSNRKQKVLLVNYLNNNLGLTLIEGIEA